MSSRGHLYASTARRALVHESDFRNRIDHAFWRFTQALGIEAIHIDSDGLVSINQGIARDAHMIRSAWPLPDNDDFSPQRDVFCARILLARCESPLLRKVSPGHLATAVRDALQRI